MHGCANGNSESDKPQNAGSWPEPPPVRTATRPFALCSRRSARTMMRGCPASCLTSGCRAVKPVRFSSTQSSGLLISFLLSLVACCAILKQHFVSKICFRTGEGQIHNLFLSKNSKSFSPAYLGAFAHTENISLRRMFCHRDKCVVVRS